MKLLLKLILVAIATFSVLVGLRTLGQMIHPGATHYWVGKVTTSGSSPAWSDPSKSNILYAWWVSSDLAVGADLYTTAWTDRVQSILIRSDVGSATNYYTNTSVGVHNNFADAISGALTNTPLTAGTNQTVALILFPEVITDTTYPIFLYSPWDFSDATQGNADTHGGLGFQKTGQIEWGTAFTGGPQLATKPAESNWYDFLLVQSNTTVFFYTNGVLAKNFSRTPPAGGYPWKWTFNDNSAANAFAGKIREIMVWSNALDIIGVSNVHYYSTNTYNYVP